MSARNMVRNLRESGSLDAKPQGSGLRSTIVVVLAALGIGAGAYLGIVFALPGVMSRKKQVAPKVLSS